MGGAPDPVAILEAGDPEDTLAEAGAPIPSVVECAPVDENHLGPIADSLPAREDRLRAAGTRTRRRYGFRLWPEPGRLVREDERLCTPGGVAD
jgi:hypothetical protein